MLSRVLLPGSLLIFLFCLPAKAQGPCAFGSSANSTKLACAIPYAFGINGLSTDGPLDPAADSLGLVHQTHFESDFTFHLPAVSSTVGSQLTSLPLSSPSSGIIFVLDKSLGVSVPSDASYGPILGERAETIGRHKLFLAFSYQFFNFESVDGADIQNLPAVFKHVDTVRTDVTPNVTCSINTTKNKGLCAFVRDLIVSNNNLSLKVNQYTMFATFGLTRKIDVSVAVPIVNARIGVNTAARVQNNSLTAVHKFDQTRTNCTGSCLAASFFSGGSATGIGDVTFRVKGTIWSGERLALGAGVDVRAPTGDELNYLGSGAAGVRPFAIISYRARISPHASAGYEWNGSSILAGDVVGGRKARLPNRFTYTTGADVLLIPKRLSGAFDIVGQRLYDAQRVQVQATQDLGTCDSPGTSSTGCQNPGPANSYQNFQVATNSYNSTSASMGLRFRPEGRLLITANVLVRLDHGGLRAKPTPLVGLSYTF